ncbi:MAG: MFS transporter [Actinobacteria bacterium]|nr:MFS transporter [Actinomycetota bacterium]
MIANYKAALHVPGTAAFTGAAFIARLPLALNGLGIVLLVSITTGSYALAGSLSAVYALCSAGGGIVSSRWADVHGQRGILLALPVVSGLAMMGFVLSIMGPLPRWSAWACVTITALCQPTIGSFVRARWAAVSPTPDIRRAGFAWESIVDELIFSIGPLLAATTAVSLWTPTPLIVSAVLLLLGSWWLGGQRATQPPLHRAPGTSSGRSALSAPGIPIAILFALGLGILFGAFDVSTVAFTEQAGVAGAAGVVLALWAGGSLIGGLYFGSRRWATGLDALLRNTAVLLALVMIPALAVASVLVLMIVAFLAGMSIAPTLISLFSVTERLVPPRLLTEGLTWVTAGLSVGFAIGSASGGAIVDAHGTRTSFGFAWAGAVLCAFLGTIFCRYIGRHLRDETPEPTVAWVEDPIPGAIPPTLESRDRLAP